MTLKEDPKSLSFPVLKLIQPVGEFYLGVLDSRLLCEITDFDVRRIIKERDFETYLGIQRPLNPKRVKEIAQYISTLDACFPTAVILSVPGVCATYDAQSGSLKLSNYIDNEDETRTVLYRQIAKVIDGQHRIEGLKSFKGEKFEVNVCIFLDLDVAEEGYIFSTVNFAQTKVNRSLVYDLYDLAKAPSPQKLCHNIAVALDRNPKSPFHEKIKRLGVATEGRFNEKITQATFVGALIGYLSRDPMLDRDIYMRGKHPVRAGAEESKILIFRNMMIDGKDMPIADVIWNYFDAVREKWPHAWDATGTGMMLNRTNGFRGLMRFLRPAYLHLTGPGGVPSKADFNQVFARINIQDDQFNTDRFLPGTSGEVGLYNALMEVSRI
jgi:DGQHR domain-containing protein